MGTITRGEHLEWAWTTGTTAILKGLCVKRGESCLEMSRKPLIDWRLKGKEGREERYKERTIEAWKRLRDATPKVWDALEPVASTVIGEAVKKALGL